MKPYATIRRSGTGARGIDTLIIVGTATNVCCESTARDAMMLNYKVFFVSDANACRTDEEHNATLAILMIMWLTAVKEYTDVNRFVEWVQKPVAGRWIGTPEHKLTLEEVNRGFELMEAQDGIRSVIDLA